MCMDGFVYYVIGMFVSEREYRRMRVRARGSTLYHKRKEVDSLALTLRSTISYTEIANCVDYRASEAEKRSLTVLVAFAVYRERVRGRQWG